MMTIGYDDAGIEIPDASIEKTPLQRLQDIAGLVERRVIEMESEGLAWALARAIELETALQQARTDLHDTLERMTIDE